MRRFLTYSMAILLIIGFILLGEVSAKDVCVDDGQGGVFIFKNIKPLKNPGQFSPLDGIWISGFGDSGPFHGAAYVKGDRTIDIGLWVHFTVPGVNFSAQLRGSTFETASGPYDNGDDGSDDGTLTFGGFVNCKSVSIP